MSSSYENATTAFYGTAAGKNDYSWSHLAIARHEVDPTQWIFSTGWYKNPSGDASQFLLVVGSGQVEPDKLTASSGAVVYNLTQVTYEYPAGTPARVDGSEEAFPVGYKIKGGQVIDSVVMQVNSDNTLSVEIGSAFTSAKRTYTR